MKFTPKSDEELALEGLLPAGEYPFTVLEAEDTTSKTGNEMIKVKLAVYPPDGGQRNVFDYLLAAMAAKLKHFCSATGQDDKYTDGTLCAYDCTGKEGFLILKTTPAKDGYDPKNEVKDYVCRSAGEVTAPSTKAAPVRKSTLPGVNDDDDEIPF